MRLFLILFTCIFPFFLIAQTHYDVLFDTDDFSLTSSEAAKLEAFAKTQLKNYKAVSITGHTDNRGSDAYNQALSERRMLTVKSALIQLGIAEETIKVDFKGESTPLNQNSSPSEMAANRRVRIHWETQEPPLDIEIEEPLGDIRELYKLLEQEKQAFCIDPNRDTLLFLDQGTIIKIPANAFRTNSTSCVTFRAKEVYNYSDMIMENLSTMSDGKLLETGGMVYTEAEDKNGTALELNSGKELTIYLPTDNPRDDMSLFYGQRDPHSDDMNWALGPRGAQRLPWENFATCRDWTPNTINCDKCSILFCRLFGRFDETMKGTVNKGQRAENKSFRQCQRRLRKNQFTGISSPVQNYCDSLYAAIGAADPAAFRDSMIAIQERNRIAQQKATEMAIEEGNSNATNLSYYVANVAQLGWMNCDAFSNLSASQKINMVIPLRKNKETDCKLIFRDRRSLMLPNNSEGRYTFSKIGEDLPVWVLALKYHDGKIFLSLKPQKTAKTGEAVDFKEVSLTELKQELARLDGK